MNNSPDLGNDIDRKKESDLRVDCKRTVSNFQQNPKYISKRRPRIVINAHPKNQTFSKLPIIPGDKSYSDAMTKNVARKYIEF